MAIWSRSLQVPRSFMALFMGALMSCASTGALAGAGPAADRAVVHPAGLQTPSIGRMPVPLSPSPAGLSQCKVAQLCTRLPFYFIENRGQLDGRVKYYEQGRGRAVYFTPEGLEFTFLREAERDAGPGRRPGRRRSLRERASGTGGLAVDQEKSGDGAQCAPYMPGAGHPAPAIFQDIFAWAFGPTRNHEMLVGRASPPATGSTQAGKPVLPTPTGGDAWATRSPRRDAYAAGSGPQAGTPVPPTLRRISLTPVGMSPGVNISGVDRQAGEVNYLQGPDPQKHHTRIPTYSAVVYEGAYPGIDLKFYGAGRQLEYDVIVRPGADPNQVSFRYQGIRGLEITRAGDLNVLLPEGGSLVQKKPVIYQEIAGVRVPREGAFRLHPGRDACRYSFTVASYDKKYPLVIDPLILYSTYLGGSGYDVGNAIAVDQSGNVYLTGCTFSKIFPTKVALDSGRSGPSDVFVTKLDMATNTLAYSTYLGGSGSEEGYGIAVDGIGCAYVTGCTNSIDFPRAGPTSQAGGDTDAFITKLNENGSALLYSVYLANDEEDASYAIAVGQDCSAWVTGEMYSQYSSSRAFVKRVGPNGFLNFSIRLSGSSDSVGYGIAVDNAGDAYVTGEIKGSDFPVTANYFQSKFGGVSDAFVIKISGLYAVIVYSAFLGGSGKDIGYGIAVDGSGCAYVTGTTRSDDFPLAGPWQSTKNGKSDAFVAKLDPAGTTLHYASYLGGDYEDEGYGIAVDSLGAAHITGWTAVVSLPPAGASAPVSESLYFTGNALVARVNPSGANPDYIMSLGGSDDDWGNGIAIAPDGHAYVTGETWSRNFPLNNPFQGILAGDADAFVAKISAAPIEGTILAPLLLD